MSSARDRNLLRGLAAARKARDLRERKPVDLFERAEALKRREIHLRFVIRRLARRLKIAEPADLDSLGEGELERIRIALSRRAGQQPEAEELAA
jgi:hypothetical protein